MAKSKGSDAKVKAQLKILKSKGLYSGDLRKAPTRYAKRQTRKFADVISGNAKVVTVKRTKIAGPKFAPAKYYTSRTYRKFGFVVKQRKVVIPIQPGEKVSLSKGRVKVTRQVRGETYTRTPIPILNRDVNNLPELRANQRYLIPFARGRGKIDYQTFTREELIRLVTEYAKSKWQTMGEYIEIQTHDFGHDGYYVKKQGKKWGLFYENDLVELFDTRDDAQSAYNEAIADEAE